MDGMGVAESMHLVPPSSSSSSSVATIHTSHPHTIVTAPSIKRSKARKDAGRAKALVKQEEMGVEIPEPAPRPERTAFTREFQSRRGARFYQKAIQDVLNTAPHSFARLLLHHTIQRDKKPQFILWMIVEELHSGNWHPNVYTQFLGALRRDGFDMAIGQSPSHNVFFQGYQLLSNSNPDRIIRPVMQILFDQPSLELSSLCPSTHLCFRTHECTTMARRFFDSCAWNAVSKDYWIQMAKRGKVIPTTVWQHVQMKPDPQMFVTMLNHMSTDSLLLVDLGEPSLISGPTTCAGTLLVREVRKRCLEWQRPHTTNYVRPMISASSVPASSSSSSLTESPLYKFHSDEEKEFFSWLSEMSVELSDRLFAFESVQLRVYPQADEELMQGILRIMQSLIPNELVGCNRDFSIVS